MSASLRLVSADEAEIRLDRWFRRHFPTLTQGVIQKWCRTGQVRVDGRRAAAATRLAPGQAVRIPKLPVAQAVLAAPRPVDPDAARELVRRVLYRDETLLVLDKPQGLPVQGGKGVALHLDGMLDALRFGHADRPRLVHRLDRDTSGVLVLARSPGAAARLAALFRGRAVQKTYWAVVLGCPTPQEGRIDLNLVRTEGPRGIRTAPAGEQTRDDARAARAITDYRTLDRVGRRFAWLELQPLTGRTHQLRAHCAAIGTPIIGDAAYGDADAALPDGVAPLLHLHARALRLPHPEGGVLEVAAGLPPPMRETFRALGFAAPEAARPGRSAA